MAHAKCPLQIIIAAVKSGAEHQFGFTMTQEEAITNSRLLIAAPIMYEALIQAKGALRLDAMVDDNGKAFGTTIVALDAIEEALRKAKEG